MSDIFTPPEDQGFDDWEPKPSCSLNHKVKDSKEFVQEHLGHGQLRTEYAKSQPPAGYKIFVTICSCGARNVGIETLPVSVKPEAPTESIFN